jgi:hypothetical protein
MIMDIHSAKNRKVRCLKYTRHVIDFIPTLTKSQPPILSYFI